MSPSFSNPIERPLIPLFFILVLADGVEGTQQPARRLLPLLGGWAWVEALGPEACPPGRPPCGLGGAWAGTGKTLCPSGPLERTPSRHGRWGVLCCGQSGDPASSTCRQRGQGLCSLSGGPRAPRPAQVKAGLGQGCLDGTGADLESERAGQRASGRLSCAPAWGRSGGRTGEGAEPTEQQQVKTHMSPELGGWNLMSHISEKPA